MYWEKIREGVEDDIKSSKCSRRLLQEFTSQQYLNKKWTERQGNHLGKYYKNTVYGNKRSLKCYGSKMIQKERNVKQQFCWK